jgi:hypothetical protein
MAITAFAPAAVVHGGLDLDTAAVTPGQTTGNTCPGGQGVCLYVKNASGGAITVTLHFTPTIDGNAVASRTVSVGAGKAFLIPIQDAYEDPATGLVTIDFSTVTSVTAQAVLVSGS